MADHAAHEALSGSERTDAEASARSIERGRVLFAGECQFVAAAADARGLPAPRLPEIAFAGRSNVGKSSLLNALTGRKALARVSRTPGRTQQINFFALAGRLGLVDLPGYGFARAPRRSIDAWTVLVEAYLRCRPTLRRVELLIDARVGAKESDARMMDLLDGAAVPYRLALTKIDRLDASALDAARAALAHAVETRPAALPGIEAVSARTGQGVAELRAQLAALVDIAGRESGVEVSP